MLYNILWGCLSIFLSSSSPRLLFGNLERIAFLRSRQYCSSINIKLMLIIKFTAISVVSTASSIRAVLWTEFVVVRAGPCYFTSIRAQSVQFSDNPCRSVQVWAHPCTSVQNPCKIAAVRANFVVSVHVRAQPCLDVYYHLRPSLFP